MVFERIHVASGILMVSASITIMFRAPSSPQVLSGFMRGQSAPVGQKGAAKFFYPAILPDCTNISAPVFCHDQFHCI